MFVPLILGCSIGIAFLRGGQLSNLGHINLRYTPLLFAPLALQLIAFSPLGDIEVIDFPAARLLYAASLGFAVLALWMNRHLPGIFWIALGLFLNFLVISLNGGFMPVSAWARTVAGLPPLLERSNNLIPMTSASVLPWLADVLPLPHFVPFANVYSPGDVLIALGGIVFTQRSLTAR